MLACCDSFFGHKAKAAKKTQQQDTLFYIASMQAEGAKKDSVIYINGFEVLTAYALSQEQSNNLRKEIAAENNYAKDISKRCLFMPSFIFKKDSSSVIMFSVEPCGKVLFTKAGKDSIVDLSTNNNIEKLINNIKEK